MSETKKKKNEEMSVDQRYIVIYGYSHDEITVVIDHFSQALPELSLIHI